MHSKRLQHYSTPSDQPALSCTLNATPSTSSRHKRSRFYSVKERLCVKTIWRAITFRTTWESCTLCLKVSLTLFCSCPSSSLQQRSNLSLQSLSNFCLASSSREFGYGNQAFNFPPSLHMVDTGNIKVSGDGLVSLEIVFMLVYDPLSDILGLFSALFPFVCVHCGAHSHAQQQSEYFAPFKLAE